MWTLCGIVFEFMTVKAIDFGQVFILAPLAVIILALGIHPLGIPYFAN